MPVKMHETTLIMEEHDDTEDQPQSTGKIANKRDSVRDGISIDGDEIDDDEMVTI